MAASSVLRRTPRDLLTAASFIAWAISVQAQERSPDQSKSDEKLQEVVITGSRIARPDLDRLQPTSVLKAESFDQRGYADVGAALQEQPSFGIPTSSAANQQSGFGVAQSFVDLYSLGSQRTLTLINGRRSCPPAPRASSTAPPPRVSRSTSTWCRPS